MLLTIYYTAVHFLSLKTIYNENSCKTTPARLKVVLNVKNKKFRNGMRL